MDHSSHAILDSLLGPSPGVVSAVDASAYTLARGLPSLPIAQLEEVLTALPRCAIREAFKDDPWQANYYLNLSEYVHHETVLTSYPWNVSLPAADNCNARCQFCTSWLLGKNFLTLPDLERFSEVLPYARRFGLQGHGEPLINIHIEGLLHRLAELLDPRVYFYIITNGLRLGALFDRLLDAHVKGFNISLNAVTAATHHKVMSLGENVLPGIIESIRRLIAIRDAGRSDLYVTISMVLTHDTVEEGAAFVRLGNELGVNRVYLRTLAPLPIAPPGLNYHLLHPTRNPRAEESFSEIERAIKLSTVEVEAFPETWRAPVFSSEVQAEIDRNPPVVISRRDAATDPAVKAFYQGYKASRSGKGRLLHSLVHNEADNPFGRKAPFSCGFVYHNLICNQLHFDMPPCCYIQTIPGHEPVIVERGVSFFEYWNSPAYVELRRSLKEGPLMGPCRSCPMQNRELQS